jgi:hypothetical protein
MNGLTCLTCTAKQCPNSTRRVVQGTSHRLSFLVHPMLMDSPYPPDRCADDQLGNLGFASLATEPLIGEPGWNWRYQVGLAGAVAGPDSPVAGHGDTTDPRPADVMALGITM